MASLPSLLRCRCATAVPSTSGPSLVTVSVRRGITSSSSPPSPAPSTTDSPTPAPSKLALSKSSVPAGTVLKGLNYLKGVPAPVALEDREYPDWLWTLTEPGMGVGKNDDPIKAMRRQLNRMNTKNIRASNFLKDKRK